MASSFARATAVFLLFAAGQLGCGVLEGDDPGSSADAVEVPQTGVRDQKETGNCWLFATLGWIESLELGAAREAGRTATVAHYSPAYLDYWDWYEKITAGAIAQKTAGGIREELDGGGSWGAAVELVSRWGLVRSKDVDPNQRDADKALAALKTMSASLATGALKTAAARSDRTLVRRELDRAFAFPAPLKQEMDRTFGDGAKNLETGATASGLVRAKEDVEVRIPRPGGEVVLRPLADAIGARAAGDDPDQRTGTYAFRVVPFTDEAADDEAATRAYFARIQAVLETKTSIPISWYWADNGDERETGRFEGVPKTPAGEAESTSHLSIIDDYEKVASGELRFLRIKNSYGARTKSTKSRPKGYDDLYASYLLGMLETCPEGVASGGKGCTKSRGLEDVTLPAGF